MKKDVHYSIVYNIKIEATEFLQYYDPYDGMKHSHENMLQIAIIIGWYW